MIERKLSASKLRADYKSGKINPRQLFAQIPRWCEEDDDYNIWIRRLTMEELNPYLSALEQRDIEDCPLYGLPFALKDNIDLQGIPSTAGCEAYSYVPDKSAYVVQQLISAGAIPVGKTNMDQFATGLVGTRSPWGACQNAYDREFISGGSSSGSALAVARSLVTFALGTDTAGSGRVPAALNNLVGVKPSCGLVSMTGVVPACRSLDCVSLFVNDSGDGRDILRVMASYDLEDAFARRGPEQTLDETGKVIAIMGADQLEFFGCKESEQGYDRYLEFLTKQGYELREVDFSPFRQAAELLYGGPWVAERYAAIKTFIEQSPEALLPVTLKIIGGAKELTAVEVFEALYELKALKRRADAILEACDVFLTPTIGRAYKISEVEQEPVALNTNLGFYTNFMNLLDCAAIAMPVTFLPSGLPFGVTLFHKAFSDSKLLSWSETLMALGK